MRRRPSTVVIPIERNVRGVADRERRRVGHLSKMDAVRFQEETQAPQAHTYSESVTHTL